MDERILIDIEVGGNGQKTLGELKAEAKELRKDMQNLVVGTDEFNKKLKDLQKTNKLIHKSNQQMKTSADGFRIALNATTKTISGLSSAIGTYAGLVGMSEKETNGLVQTITKVQTAMAFAQTVQSLGQAFTALRTAFALLNTTMLANPFVAVAAGLVALGAVLYTFMTSVDDTNAKLKSLNEAYKELNQAHLSYAEAIYKDTGLGYERVLEEREKLIENIGIQIANETDKLAHLTKGTEEYIKQLAKISDLELQQYNIRAKTQKEADEAFEKDKKAAEERDKIAQKEIDDTKAKAQKELEIAADKAYKEGEQFKADSDRISAQQASLADRLLQQAFAEDEAELAREQSVIVSKEKMNNELNAYIISESKKAADAQKKHDDEVAANAKKVADYRKAYAKSVYDISDNFLQAGMTAIEENTVAYKALASAQVIMDTAKGVMGITASMSQAGLAAPALIAAGVASVVAMGATQLAAVNGAFDKGSSKSMPNMTANVPQQQVETPAPVYLSDMQLANVGSNQRVYILDSDIVDSIRRVEVTDSDTTY